MTAPTVSITESALLTILRAWLLSVLPSGVEVVRGQQNRVPEPSGSDFVVFIPILRERLTTNVVTYSDPYPATPSTRTDTQQTQITVQVDVHGPNSADNVTVVQSLFRAEPAATFFEATNGGIDPLYTSDPRQLQFIDGEQQVEDRWSIDLVMQANIAITNAQDFAGTVTPNITPPVA